MTTGKTIKTIVNDVRFWILFFFCLRLVGITNAPLEEGHNWRQALTSMIARNFLEGDANIMYPTIDMAGERTGIIGAEFPFYNYLIYLTSLLFDYSHWCGRLINLVVSSIGIFYFYLLVEKACNRKVAFHATIILLSSIWLAYSRKIMPDTFSVSLVIIGLYYGYIYLTKGKTIHIFLFLIFVTLGMLCKIPGLSLLALIAIVPFVTEIPRNRKLAILAFTVLSISVAGTWYFYWVPYLVDTYHYQLFFPKRFEEGLHEIIPLLPEYLEKFYFSSLCSFFALIFLLTGLISIFRSRNLYLMTGIILITLSFLAFTLTTGAVFPKHSYYIIPFTPVMALIAGYGLSKFPGRYQYLLLAIISLEGIANQQHDFFIKDRERYKTTLEGYISKTIGKSERIVINGGDSPQLIYFAHRKGWTITNDGINKKELDHLHLQGASFLIIDKKSFRGTIDYYPLLSTNEYFAIYRLK